MKKSTITSLATILLVISFCPQSSNANEFDSSNKNISATSLQNKYSTKNQLVKLSLDYPRSIYSGVPFVITVKASKAVSGTCKVVDFYTGSTKTTAKISNGKARIKVTNYWITGGLNSAQSFVVTCKGSGWSGKNDTIQWGN